MNANARVADRSRLCTIDYRTASDSDRCKLIDHRMGLGRKTLLFAVIALATVGGYGQPQFDIATVKRSPETGTDRINIDLGNIRNGKLTLTNASLSDCLKFAYGLVSDSQLAGPDWIRSKFIRFDVVAQVPRDTPREQALLMLQTLLTDRLKLVLHHEQKEQSFLALVPGKNGPKLQEAKADAPPTGKPQILGRITSNQMSMGTLAMLLSRFQRQTILDLTGLKGFFEVKLEWTPDNNRPLPPGGDAADVPSGPSLFTAVGEQLGLKLESRKGPVDVLVVDRAEQVPAEN